MSIELTAVKAGLSRLRTKGKARADSLHTLTNGYVTAARTIKSRPGTARHATLPAGTFGLTAFDGNLHVFAPSALSAVLPLDDTGWTHDARWTIAGGVATFAGGMVVAASETSTLNNMIVVSADGVTWQAAGTSADMHSANADPVWSDALGQFLVVRAGAPRSFTSTNGLTWTENVTNATMTSRALIRVDALGLYVLGAEGINPIWTSPDGITWTQRTLQSMTIMDFSWSPTLGRLVAIDETGTTAHSTDGISWTVDTSGLSSQHAIKWSAALGLFCITGNGVSAVASDGLNWTTSASGPSSTSGVLAWSPTLALFCAVGGGGIPSNAFTSPDGLNWTVRTGLNAIIGALTWFDFAALFIAIESTVGQDSVWTSPDGITWTERALPTEEGGEAWGGMAIGLAVPTPQSMTNNKVHFAAPGLRFSATADVKSASPNIGGRVGIAWYDSAGALLSTSYAATFTTNTAGLFVTSTVTATAPANTASARVVVQANGSAEFQNVVLTELHVPTGFVLHFLKHPDNQALKKIHFAAPFLGALYVVAEFANDDIYHFWLQQADAWAASTEYTANEFVAPTTLNGFVYKATRLGSPNQSWAPNVPRAVNDLIEPTVYNEYFYKATQVNGTPRSASVEPIWPTNTGETIVENSEAEEADENTSVAPPAPPSANQPQSITLEKYLRGGGVGPFF